MDNVCTKYLIVLKINRSYAWLLKNIQKRVKNKTIDNKIQIELIITRLIQFYFYWWWKSFKQEYISFTLYGMTKNGILRMIWRLKFNQIFHFCRQILFYSSKTTGNKTLKIILLNQQLQSNSAAIRNI